MVNMMNKYDFLHLYTGKLCNAFVCGFKETYSIRGALMSEL